MIVSLLDTLPPGNALNISKLDAPTYTSEEAMAAYLDDESNPKIWEEAKFYASLEHASKLA
eukprot:3654387-Ditylum_brightwellii.AAC.1